MRRRDSQIGELRSTPHGVTFGYAWFCSFVVGQAHRLPKWGMATGAVALQFVLRSGLLVSVTAILDSATGNNFAESRYNESVTGNKPAARRHNFSVSRPTESDSRTIDSAT